MLHKIVNCEIKLVKHNLTLLFTTTVVNGPERVKAIKTSF